jgi:hypothetical protein
MTNLEITYTATDELHNPRKTHSNCNLLISRYSFVAVDCSNLPEWSN